ncbi:DUF1853 family protein [Pricia sp. S334]|uniref:DUF1853 family protein n=1 Tax=Pricia mediterranea TaxID=3076079 RepID=A0ABU3LBN2_9FLAO|nr:DUF1853 family protein [Pricia sp. S334]MDT7830604.1 DUF1853 family protein [Pricia sp. S334]
MKLEKQIEGFLATPPLWIKEQFGIRQFEFPKIDLSYFSPKPIPKRIRLGHQMEHVFNQLIKSSADFKILLHNLAIKSNNRTIGEIDFILRETETGKLLHIELTYKFYIIDTAISEPVHQLMGPNRRDMFFTKIEKIKQRQFPLLHTAEGREALRQKGIDLGKTEHQCCFKSQLFVPYGNGEVHIRPLNKACISGYWIGFDDFGSERFKDYSFYIPYKSEWVVPPHNNVTWQSHYAVLMDINLRMLKENAPMVWMRKSDTKIEKLFVVWWGG